MKTTIFKISILFLLLCLMGAGCEKEKSVSFLSGDVGNLVSAFELKYGDSTEIDCDNEKLLFTIKNVIDSVTVDCSLTDFSNNSEGPLNIRVYAYLQVNDQDEVIEVASKPCGALVYGNNGHDIDNVLELINNLESAPANSVDTSYFSNEFINLFGEGSQIQNTPFKIFMAKAYPAKYSHSDAIIDNYKFIFIVTSRK